MELGVFIAFLVVGALGLWRNRSLPLTAISLAALFAIGFLMSLGENVVLTSTETAAGSSSIVATPYDVTSRTAARSVYDATNSIDAEYMSSSSSALDNQPVNCFSMMLNKLGSPPSSSIIQAGVYDGSGVLKHEFGTMNTTLLSISSQWFQFCSADSYTLVSGDRVGIKYTGGNSTNAVQVSTDNTDPFDGTLTYTQRYDASLGTWASATSNDMTATMTLTGAVPSSTTTTPIINDYHVVWSWIFFGLAIVVTFLFTRNAITLAGWT